MIPATPSFRKRRRVAGFAAVLIVLAASLFGAYVLFWPRDAAPNASATQPFTSVADRTIAVLPFTNVGADPEQEYFSDGLTEELIAALSQMRALRVAARTSVFAFKGEERDIREIGRALNVATVLEGSVRRQGDRLRIHAQLIDAANGFHLWSDTYERRAADIFDIQTELALRIAGALEAELTAAERQRLARQPTESMEAHSAYLKGRYYWKQRSSGGLAKAIQFFEQAIAADPRYARAHAGLASAYGPMAVLGFISPREGKELMRAAVGRALELDPELPEAHTALAGYLSVNEWNFAAAEREFLRAIEMDPDESSTHFWYGFLLEAVGRLDEAVAQRRLGMELDPMAPIANSGLGRVLLMRGDVEHAVESLTKAVGLDSTYWQAHLHLGRAYELKGELEKSIHAFESAVAYGGRSPQPRAGLAGALARAGRESEARQILEVLRSEATTTAVHAPAVAPVFFALRDPQAAFDWLENSYRERHPDLPHFLNDPASGAPREDRRFRDLKRRVGISN